MALRIDSLNLIYQIDSNILHQGTVLGQLLFPIFMNDFSKCSTFFKYTLSADESTLSCKFNNTPANEIKLYFNHPTNSHKYMAFIRLHRN